MNPSILTINAATLLAALLAESIALTIFLSAFRFRAIAGFGVSDPFDLPFVQSRLRIFTTYTFALVSTAFPIFEAQAVLF